MEPVSIGDSLRDFMRRSPAMKRSRVAARVGEAWRAVAGPSISKHTNVRGLSQGILTVAVDSPPLCHELSSFHREGLLVRLKEKLANDTVRGLRFRLGTIEDSA